MKYAVAFASLFDNELTIQIVEAESWSDAIAKHTEANVFDFPSSSIEDAKREFFNSDALIDVICIEA